MWLEHCARRLAAHVSTRHGMYAVVLEVRLCARALSRIIPRSGFFALSTISSQRAACIHTPGRVYTPPGCVFTPGCVNTRQNRENMPGCEI